MSSGVRVLGLIPARGGSKRLPGKNLLPIGGRPLIGWTIDAALEASAIDRVVVSTDSPEIAEVARGMGADVPFLRPAELADDDAGSVAVALHALEWLEQEEGESYDFLMLLQPTSPLRTAAHMDEAVALLLSDGRATSLTSVYPMDKPAAWLRWVDEGLLAAPPDVVAEMTGQMCILSGAIYLVKVDDLRASGRLVSEPARAFVMDVDVSVDIDTQKDFDRAADLLQRALVRRESP